MNSDYKKMINEDLYRYSAGKKQLFTTSMRLYGWQYMKIWRKVQYYSNRNSILRYFYLFLLYRKSLKYGFQISPYAKIGRGLYIGHFGTVIVSNEAQLGDNVNLSPNVVIGRENRGNRLGSPMIGSKVWIGSGSVVTGKITIGDNVLIAPNSYVNFDVPSNSLVIGNSIKHNDNATTGYINNCV